MDVIGCWTAAERRRLIARLQAAGFPCRSVAVGEDDRVALEVELSPGHGRAELERLLRPARGRILAREP
ncbi:hypothetical protein NBH00_20240 [Paraconexibacter antarcticus]|uniref:Uncharacterized protein n=1 Tax=Paraconexibacter antarcticus TaxID=2949664 RepID=A0ABY5DSI8_9ACTN|nr:hypothetical protein [Paraconexibacter antarcticus]UTI63660.1 hypothetical protein NBH00_20240 [Paraconexibacter antarcticus]